MKFIKEFVTHAKKNPKLWNSLSLKVANIVAISALLTYALLQFYAKDRYFDESTHNLLFFFLSLIGLAVFFVMHQMVQKIRSERRK